MDADTPAKPSRFRLSLASLLLITTCVCLGLGLGIPLLLIQERVEADSRRMSRLHDENRRLREQYGEFNVEDPTLLYAAQINRDETADSNKLDWRWRVYTPEPYTLCFADGAVSKKGFPTARFSRAIEPGYHTIRVHYQPEFHDPTKAWQIELRIRSETEQSKADVRSSMDVKGQSWPPPLYTPADKWPIASPVEGVYWGTVTVRHDHSQLPNKRIVLQRLIVQPGDPGTPRGAGHADWLSGLDPSAQVPGFVIWLERVRN